MEILRNILGVLSGVIVGSIVNMGIIILGGIVFPLPENIDQTDPEWLSKSIHLFETKHFIAPFAAHAIGTVVGVIVAVLIAVSRKKMIAMIIGVVFLAGGIMMVVQIDAPLWFESIDLSIAYIPMALLGYSFAKPKTKS